MACDPYWNKTVLAMHFDGANGSTTFTDEKGHTPTVFGDAKISTAQSKIGGSSLYLDGTGDYLTFAASPDFNLYQQDFTIECWLYLAGTGDRHILGYNNTTQDYWDLRVNSTGNLIFRPAGGGASLTSTGTVTAGQWVHIAVVCQRLVTTIYIGGVASGTLVAGISTANGSFVLAIGRNTYGSPYDFYYNGYIDGLRITKAARYLGNFTPDTSAFLTNQCTIGGTIKDSAGANAARLVRTLRRDSLEVMNVSLSDASTGVYTHPVETTGECVVLAHDGILTDPYAANVKLALKMAGTNGSTTFTDDAGHTTTANGDVKIVSDAFLYGRSAAHFDGTGDYIACAYSTDYEVGSGDFTVEFWFKVPNVSGQKTMFAFQTDFHFGIFLNGNRMNCFASSNGSSWTPISGDTNGNLGAGYTDVTANVWHHFAWVRSGTTWTAYLDGKLDRQLTGISDAVVTRNEALNIGRWGNGALMLTGYIKDFRLTKSARYSAPFQLPLPDFIPAPTAGTENAVVLDRVLPV